MTKMRVLRTLFLILSGTSLPSLVLAEADYEEARSYRIEVSAGLAGIMHPRQIFFGTTELRLPAVTTWRIHPAVGFGFGEKRAYYLFADLRRDFYLSPDWIITPSFGAGFFDGRGALNLGYDLEFRSALALFYHFNSRQRLGLSFSHLSNASLSDYNPGTETLSLVFSQPL